MNRVLDIVRLHLLDPRPLLGTLLVVPVFVALGVGVMAAEISTSGSAGKAGLVGAFYGAITAVQAPTVRRLLPFAVAMGRTRRDYYLGTLLFVLLEVLVIGVVLTLLLVVEQRTGGWGAGLPFLGEGWATVDDPGGQFLVFAAPLLLTFPMVLPVVVAFARWDWIRLLLGAALAGAVAFAVVIVAGLLTVGLGTDVGHTVRLVAIGAVAAVGGWFVVRRAPV